MPDEELIQATKGATKVSIVYNCPIGADGRVAVGESLSPHRAVKPSWATEASPSATGDCRLVEVVLTPRDTVIK